MRDNNVKGNIGNVYACYSDLFIIRFCLSNLKIFYTDNIRQKQ